MHRTIALSVLLALAGCAAQQQKQMLWDKQGWNQADASADEGQCRAQALSVPGAMNNMVQVAAVFGSCMQGKGYYQRPAY